MNSPSGRSKTVTLLVAATFIAGACGSGDEAAAPTETSTEADTGSNTEVLDQQDEGMLSLGSPASAHGNHNVQSSWWSIEQQADAVELSNLEPIVVYDAVASDSGAIIYATLEVLSIGDEERIDLVSSRSIRFVAG